MEYSFIAFGHPNISAKHKTTIEFTKDRELTLKGDCIIGINSDFKLERIKKFIKDNLNNKKIKIIVKVGNLTEEINCAINPNFNHDKEIVIRKSDFISKRTLGVKADKACADLNRGLIDKLKNSEQRIKIIFTLL